MCENKRKFCENFKAFVEENNVFIKSQIEKYSETNDYWHQLNLIYKQLEGMEKGFELWQNENNRTPVENQVLNPVLVLNLAEEIYEFEKFLNPEPVRYEGHCSAFIKPLADGSDLFVAHDMWASFDTMLRIMKKYKFAFKSIEKERIPGHSVAFSSYPGNVFPVQQLLYLIFRSCSSRNNY